MKTVVYLWLVLVLGVFPTWAIDLNEKTTDFNSLNVKELASFLDEKASKVLNKYGAPVDLSPLGDDQILMDYGAVSFTVRNNSIIMVAFWSSYTGAVEGIKIGMKKREVEELWGKPDSRDKSSLGNALDTWGKPPLRYSIIYNDDDAVNVIRIHLS